MIKTDKRDETPSVEAAAEEASDPGMAMAQEMVTQAFKLTEVPFPEVTKLLQLLKTLLPPVEFLHAVSPGLNELFLSAMRPQQPQDAFAHMPDYQPPPPMPRDEEADALSEIVDDWGFDGLSSFGGGIFGAGEALSRREGITNNVLTHLKTRVKESYENGVADGREALLKEQLEAETSA